MTPVVKIAIARPTGMHYNHCVSPTDTVRSFVRPLAVSENAHNSLTTSYILIKFCILIHFYIAWTSVCQTFSGLYRLALFGMYTRVVPVNRGLLI